MAPAAPTTRSAQPHDGRRRPEPPPRTPFGVADELSCYYDTPAEPCTVHIEAGVAGHLDEPALRLAVGAALAEHPRAMVRRVRAGWWRHRAQWEQPGCPDIDPVAVTTWADADELRRVREQFLSFSPPLDSSPPVRILLAAGPGEDRVIVNAHHAALDGISCLELLRSVSRHYQARVSGEPVPDSPVTTAAPEPVTAGPGRTAGPRAPASVPRPAARIAVDHGDTDHGDAARGAGDAQRGRPGYGFRLLRRPVPVIPRAGQGPRPTVNDLLIAALVVTIDRWNSGHGRPSGRIRITMPINSRAPGQAGAAGNLSRLAAVTAAAPPPGRDLAQLIADVAAQTRWAKDHPGPQVDALSRALAAAWCPPAVKRLVLRLALRAAGPLLCDTSLVSNLGIVADPPMFGSTQARGMWFSTVAHMPRGLSVGAVTIGSDLHLCLRYRRALFSEPAAARFASSFAAGLAYVTRDATAGAARDSVPEAIGDLSPATSRAPEPDGDW
jgi:NRPS condensation-like uncharacterized protein